VTYMDLRFSHPENPPFGVKVIHKMPLPLSPGQVRLENVKMGKRALGAFLAKSSTKWHPKGGQRGGKGGSKGGLLQKSGRVSPISEMRLTSGGTWDWGLGTGGGMRINSDDCMKASLSGRRGVEWTPAAGTGRCAARRPARAPALVHRMPGPTPTDAGALPRPTY